MKTKRSMNFYFKDNSIMKFVFIWLHCYPEQNHYVKQISFYCIEIDVAMEVKYCNQLLKENLLLCLSVGRHKFVRVITDIICPRQLGKIEHNHVQFAC